MNAVNQAELYLDAVTARAADVGQYLSGRLQRNVKVLRPKAIVLVGMATSISTPQQRDDFRRLTDGLNRVTYDDLVAKIDECLNAVWRSAGH